MRTRCTVRGVQCIVHRTLALFAASALLAAGVLQAQRTIDWSTKPVLLMTMGQGDEVFEKFGHNAIVVWDDASGQPVAYNWGMFDFNQPNFLGRFLSGDTKYWMEARSLERTMRDYEALNRTVTVQQLQLTPAQKTRLVALLADNATEENKYYRYDYYRDNCSTRARDAIDAVTDGALKRAMRAQPGQGSYRWHTRRLLAYSAPLYFGSELVLGVDADNALTGWEEAFLPQSLSESIMRIDMPAADGLPQRLLAAPADTLLLAQRGPEPRTATLRLAIAALAGILIGVVLLGLTRLGKVPAAIGVMVWSLLIAGLGLVLLLAWFATQHVFMANNPSVALVNPVWFVGVAAAVTMMRNGVPRGLRRALRWLLVVAVTGTAGAVLLGHAGSALELAALLLPAHAAVAYAADRYRNAPRSVS